MTSSTEDFAAPTCPCSGQCHHSKAPCSLGCWAAQKPWRPEEEYERGRAAARPADGEGLRAEVVRWVFAQYAIVPNDGDGPRVTIMGPHDEAAEHFVRLYRKLARQFDSQGHALAAKPSPAP